MKTRYVAATEFKAKCLGLLDEVNATGDSVTITKRGKPIAVLHALLRKPLKSPRGILAGQLEIPEDLENINFADDWEVVREREETEVGAAPKGHRKAS